jgi:hypothetical protein
MNDIISTGMGLTILVGILIVIGICLWMKYGARSVRGLYQPAKLMSAAESGFYRTLQRSCPNHLVILAKVRLADLVSIPSSLRGKDRFRIFAPLAQKHVDYVVYDPARNEVVRIIELNDSSHHQMERRQRDMYIRDVLESAGLKLVFVPLKRNYQAAEIDVLFR